MKFKNDKERIAFLKDYRNGENGWYSWKNDPEIDRRWWRYDLPDCALIVEEDRRTLLWPEPRQKWFVVNWFIIRDWSFKDKTFRDQVGSRSMALAEIKRCQKEGLL